MLPNVVFAGAHAPLHKNHLGMLLVSQKTAVKQRMTHINLPKSLFCKRQPGLTTLQR
jgi:hypothetical protein